MKTWSKIEREFEYLLGTAHGMDKVNGASLRKYFLNPEDGKFTWEEKRVILYLLQESSEMKKSDMKLYDLTQNECDVFGLSQIPITYAEWDENWNIVRFTIYVNRIIKVEDEDGFHYETRQDSSLDIYDDMYDGEEYEKLVGKFGPHWSAVKAGLRGWYLQYQREGVKGFERKPTNF